MNKKKRKALLKNKRQKKIARGINVPFNLQKSPKHYHGFSNKFCYKTHIHRLIYKKGKFFNVKYLASNLTYCNFVDVSFCGVDFFNSNLKGCKFKGAKLSNVVFFNCNFKNCDFTNATFKNVKFLSCNIQVANNLTLSNDCEVIKTYPNLPLIPRLSTSIKNLSDHKVLFTPHVLHVTTNKINMWTIAILLQKTNQEDLARCFEVLCKRDKIKDFNTIFSYQRFIDSYLKI